MVASGFRSHSSRRTMSALKKKLDFGSVCLLIYIIAILYITLFSRPRSLMSVAHFNAFWSYRRWISHGFDNRGFRPTGNNELAGVDGYRVFEKEIPTEYPVTSITVGFNPGSGVTWSKSFRLSE